MGRHGLGCINDNGEWFANLFAFNDLVISDSVFSATMPFIKPHGSRLVVHHPTILKLAESEGEAVRVKRGAGVASATISCLRPLK